MRKQFWDKNGNIILPTVRTPRVRVPNQKYWFIVGVVKGRNYLEGGFDTREEAEAFAFKNLRGVVWELVESSRKDRCVATQRRKHSIVEDGGDFAEAVRPMKHKI